MTAPWFKFYPTDWRGDVKLRTCSLPARALWMEMLCVMHEAVPRGSFLVNGTPVKDRQLAGLAGCSLEEAVSLMAELESAGVFSRDSDGVAYSRRMRRDEVKAATDRENGSTGGNPRLNPRDNPPDKPRDKAQIPEARIQKINSSNGSNPAREHRGFPNDGSIQFSEPFAGIARRKKPGVDVDLLAAAFRSFCRGADIDLGDPLIARKFETFCVKHKFSGLAA